MIVNSIYVISYEQVKHRIP